MSMQVISSGLALGSDASGGISKCRRTSLSDSAYLDVASVTGVRTFARVSVTFENEIIQPGMRRRNNRHSALFYRKCGMI